MSAVIHSRRLWALTLNGTENESPSTTLHATLGMLDPVAGAHGALHSSEERGGEIEPHQIRVKSMAATPAHYMYMCMHMCGVSTQRIYSRPLLDAAAIDAPRPTRDAVTAPTG